MAQKIEPQTIEWEIERIRGYIVQVMLDEIRAKELNRTQAQQMAQDALEMTGQITNAAQVREVLEQLVQKHPLLEITVVKHLTYIEDQLKAAAATRITKLLREGKIEEAGALAKQYTIKDRYE